MADGGASLDVLNASAQGQLRSIIERVERLEVEKAEIADQIKEVFAEAKGNGFDVKILRMVVRLRRQDPAKRAEEEAVLDLYMSALGELPLFEPRSESADTRVTISMGDVSIDTTTSGLGAMAREAELYAQAVATVRESGKGSTSYVQRRLQLGYNRAAALIERMEREGVLGPPNAAGKREVLSIQA